MLIDVLGNFLQTFPPETVLVVEYAACCLMLVCMFKFFKLPGLFTYIALAVIIGNIQVLKTVTLNFNSYPIALGTTIFSSTFLATDIITEFYGAQAARKAVQCSFIASLSIFIFMGLTVGMQPASGMPETFMPVDQAIHVLFSPAPALFLASLISFLISQYTDIWIFQSIRRLTGAGKLWLRTIVSTVISALLDNILFSIMAWRLFAEKPVPYDQLIFTYILGTYILRLFITLLQTPLLYGVRAFMKRDSYVLL